MDNASEWLRQAKDAKITEDLGQCKEGDPIALAKFITQIDKEIEEVSNASDYKEAQEYLADFTSELMEELRFGKRSFRFCPQKLDEGACMTSLSGWHWPFSEEQIKFLEQTIEDKMDRASQPKTRFGVALAHHGGRPDLTIWVPKQIVAEFIKDNEDEREIKLKIAEAYQNRIADLERQRKQIQDKIKAL